MPNARILDGKALANRLQAELAQEVQAWSAVTGVKPGLAVVLVGAEPASMVYVRNKRKAAHSAGFEDHLIEMPSDISQQALVDEVEKLNSNPAVHGILVQLPLPKHLDSEQILRRIRPEKDADGFHPVNMGLLALGTPKLVPCTPLGVKELLIRESISTKGKREGGDATVTIAHTASEDMPGLCREADILVVAAGQPEMVKGSWIKPGAVVIDVGIHRRADGSLCGDVDFAEASEVASAITPVPGGVGPLTIAMLLRNTFEAAKSLVSSNPS